MASASSTNILKSTSAWMQQSTRDNWWKEIPRSRPNVTEQFPTTDAKFTISCIPAAYWYVFVSGPLMHTPVPAAFCESRQAFRKHQTTYYLIRAECPG